MDADDDDTPSSRVIHLPGGLGLTALCQWVVSQIGPEDLYGSGQGRWCLTPVDIDRVLVTLPSRQLMELMLMVEPWKS